MKYILIALIVFIGCKTAGEKANEDLSSQSLEAAKRSLDSIHMLTRTASAGEVTLESIEKKVEQLQGDVKKYSASFSESDSKAFLDYDHKKQEETIEWMNKDGH